MKHIINGYQPKTDDEEREDFEALCRDFDNSKVIIKSAKIVDDTMYFETN